MSQPRRNVTRLVLGYGINKAWKKTIASSIRAAAETLWTETSRPGCGLLWLIVCVDMLGILCGWRGLTSPQEVT